MTVVYDTAPISIEFFKLSIFIPSSYSIRPSIRVNAVVD